MYLQAWKIIFIFILYHSSQSEHQMIKAMSALQYITYHHKIWISIISIVTFGILVVASSSTYLLRFETFFICENYCNIRFPLSGGSVWLNNPLTISIIIRLYELMRSFKLVSTNMYQVGSWCSQPETSH